MVSDTLSVIPLCLLHTLLLNTILSSICAICSNIPELGSWKDCNTWNGICFSYYKQVSFYAGPMSEKRCGNQNSANQTQNSHLKLYFWGVRGLTLILYIVQLYHYWAYRPRFKNKPLIITERKPKWEPKSTSNVWFSSVTALNTELSTSTTVAPETLSSSFLHMHQIH